MKRLTVCLSIGRSVCLPDQLRPICRFLFTCSVHNFLYHILHPQYSACLTVSLSVWRLQVFVCTFVHPSVCLHVCAFWSTLLGPSVYLSVSRCLYVLMHVCPYVWLTPPLPFSGVLHFISSSIMPVNTTYHILTGSKFLYWSIKACIRSSNPSA